MKPQESVSRSERMGREWWVLVSVGVGTFMSALDSSVVNTVLPVMVRSLGNTVSTLEWVVTIYMLVVSGLLLSFGRLGDLRGHKRYYVFGFSIFILSSALCGLAPTAGVLILFRVLQGIGAAFLFANAPAILTKNYPASRRGEVLGLQASMTYLGLTAGPSLGGWLTGLFGWRVIFFINVPVGLLALALSQRFIPGDSTSSESHQFDLAGSLTWTSGLAALLLVLNRGHAYGWGSPRTVSLLAASALFLATFVIIEAKVPHPMLDLSLFLRRPFSVATASSVMNYTCVYSIVFLMPFYLIQGRGYSPARAGLVLTIPSLTRAVASPLFGVLSDKVGARGPSTLGMALLSGGLVLLSRLGSDSALKDVIVALLVAGLGAGMFVSPNTSALMGSAPRHQQGIAAGVMATARNVGMAMGVGMAGALFTTVLARAPQNDAGSALFQAIGAGFLSGAGVAAAGTLVCAAAGPMKRETEEDVPAPEVGAKADLERGA